MARAQDVINREWGHDLIGSWNTAGWFDLPKRLGDQLAPLIGARGGEVVVTDSTSLNLFKALAGALRMQADASPAAVRRVIVSERANFPTDLYIAESLAGWRTATRCAWSTQAQRCRRRSTPTAPSSC